MCLNDQTVEGRDKLPCYAAPHATEKFFRGNKTNGKLGPEGPAGQGSTTKRPIVRTVYLPDAVRDQFIDETSESTPDGKKWPKGPNPKIFMDAGDAVSPCTTFLIRGREMNWGRIEKEHDLSCPQQKTAA
ncbi:MAG: hypothetical protein Ct9H300mP8_00800 [Gammaproteobacteria bacterium]|nr:MAG: hypothetical protein Ct9H300mP8_00800 [Gammaproteobacteria bacterium]